MTEIEKLRSLLAEARKWMGYSTPEAREAYTAAQLRIDAALAEVTDAATIRWVKIPAGSVTTADGRVLTVEHEFELAATPTTQAQYESVVGENPSYFRGPDLPVESVTAFDADAFAAKIGARLPTAIEWEYAALAGARSDPYGPVSEIAWCYENSGNQTRPVGTKKPNAWGLHDMLGNVWEWTATVDAGIRVVRGGGWFYNAARLRASSRGGYGPGVRSNSLGFRCARGGVR